MPDPFDAGARKTKRSLVSRKSVKSCARPPPPRKAQPRRAALTLQPVASRSAFRPSIGHRHATAKLLARRP
eukprot:scaffold33756_cov60-Phaeocystis_antarctica.AAC.3